MNKADIERRLRHVLSSLPEGQDFSTGYITKDTLLGHVDVPDDIGASISRKHRISEFPICHHSPHQWPILGRS